MTDFGTQLVGGPVIHSYTSKGKGDIVNRTKCAGEHMKNNAVCALQGAAITGGSVLTAVGLKKSPKLVNAVAKGIDKVSKTLFHGKFADKLLALSPKMKAFGALGVIAGSALAYVAGKQIYKMGQIDQKYTDRARIDA